MAGTKAGAPLHSMTAGPENEGTLDVLWENRADFGATPKFGLVFIRYQGFVNGAQPVKRLVGVDALESYLLEVGLAAEEAKEWIEKLEKAGSVSITHVWMPCHLLGDFQRPEN